jgi:hypothetical protein
MNVLKSLTLNDKTYDSFNDKEAIKSINGTKPDENGNVNVELPDLENYATQQYVEDEIDTIRHEVVTSSTLNELVNEFAEAYATKQYVEDYINEALGGEY